MAEETQQTAFDAEAFKASIMEEVNKMVQGVGKDLKKTMEKSLKQVVPQATVTETNVETDSTETQVEAKGNSALPPEINAALKKLKALEANVGNLTKERDAERTARLESERKSAIQDALSGVLFRDDAAARLFRKGIDSDIVRDDEGSLVARVEDGKGGFEFLPVTDYIKSQVDLQPGLLAPQGRGGSGATGSKGMGGAGYSLEDIKPGMDRATRDAILKQATQLL